MTPISAWLWFASVFALAGIVALDRLSKRTRRRLILATAALVIADFLVFVVPQALVPEFSRDSLPGDLAMRAMLLLGAPVIVIFFTRVALRALARR